MDNKIETRTFKMTELRASNDGDVPALEGLAAVFGSFSHDLGGFVEVIEPGFFDDVLADDVRCLLNHDKNYVLGRTKSGTLEISQRADGLFQRTRPPVVDPDSAQWAKDLMVSVKRGDIDQMSFAFIVKPDGDDWQVVGDKIVRTLKQGGCERLLDVSVVTYPAYEQTTVSANARSRYQTFEESVRMSQAAEAEGETQSGQAPVERIVRELKLKSILLSEKE